MKTKNHFLSSYIFTFFGAILAAIVGYYYSGTAQGALSAAFLCLILSVLEVSLSFDNAVVNASVLGRMTPLWQHRFLTWGMLIAVFGMRLVFPLLVVGIAVQINPIAALKLAIFSPTEYAQIMLSVHHQVSAFGGTFLMLVALKYFFNTEKENHWFRFIEAPLAKMGKLEAIEVGVVIAFIAFFGKFLDFKEQLGFIYAGLAGIVTYLGVEAIGTFLHVPGKKGGDLHRASLGMFLYLEVLDASFSFDGVVGAFALTNNLFIITIGLGIGAMFVRSLTIMMVDRGTLGHFKFLEHGAFYAVAALATIMYMNVVIDVPEIITGFVGAGFILASIWSSTRDRKKSKGTLKR
jgi:hypothetical protein